MMIKCPYCGTNLESLDSALYHADSVHTTQPRRWEVIKHKWEEAREKEMFVDHE